MRLSTPQLYALQAFAGPHGSDYGHGAPLKKRTAEALARKGLITLGKRRVSLLLSVPHGAATQAGRDELYRRGLLQPDPLDERDEYPLGYMQGRGAPRGCGG